MNKLFGVLLLILIFYCCKVKNLPSVTCGDYRCGRFVFNVYNESGLGHWSKLTYFIERSDTLELVTSAHFPNDTSIFRITWAGACEYKLLHLNPKTDVDSFLVRQHPTGTIHRIVKAEDDYFILKNYERRDTIWKVR